MTQEERQLLLKDLSARVPYGVKCNVQDGKINKDYVLTDIHTNGYGFDNKYGVFYGSKSFIVKPYLRPMSSMTEEEEEEWYWLQRNAIHVDYGEEGDERTIDIPYLEDVINWLNAHHFDYRGLIEKGLALEAPEGMYKV